MQPPIILSTLDLERLERLLDATPATPTSQALRAELDRAEVVEPRDMPPDVVTMNSTVRFAMAPQAPGSEPLQRTLVYPKDHAGQPDRLSVLAPLGAALLGLRVGQCIQWPGPAGRAIEAHVEALIHQPERAGELHR